jgi:hypothetical protein
MIHVVQRESGTLGPRAPNSQVLERRGGVLARLFPAACGRDVTQHLQRAGPILDRLDVMVLATDLELDLLVVFESHALQHIHNRHDPSARALDHQVVREYACRSRWRARSHLHDKHAVLCPVVLLLHVPSSAIRQRGVVKRATLHTLVHNRGAIRKLLPSAAEKRSLVRPNARDVLDVVPVYADRLTGVRIPDPDGFVRGASEQNRRFVLHAGDAFRVALEHGELFAGKPIPLADSLPFNKIG